MMEHHDSCKPRLLLVVEHQESYEPRYPLSMTRLALGPSVTNGSVREAKRLFCMHYMCIVARGMLENSLNFMVTIVNLVFSGGSIVKRESPA